MGIALIGMTSPMLNTVTVQGNQVLATPYLPDPSGISAFTRGIYLGAVEGSVGGAIPELGNTSTGFAWDLLVQFAAGPTLIGQNRFIGTGVDISAANASVTIEQNKFAPEVLITSPALRQPANKKVPTNPLLGGTVGSRGSSLLTAMPKA